MLSFELWVGECMPVQLKREEDVENNLQATNFITLCCDAVGKRSSIPTAASLLSIDLCKAWW